MLGFDTANSSLAPSPLSTFFSVHSHTSFIVDALAALFNKYHWNSTGILYRNSRDDSSCTFLAPSRFAIQVSFILIFHFSAALSISAHKNKDLVRMRFYLTFAIQTHSVIPPLLLFITNALF